MRPLRNRVGFITDIYDEYVEIQEENTNEFYIVIFNDLIEAQ